MITTPFLVVTEASLLLGDKELSPSSASLTLSDISVSANGLLIDGRLTDGLLIDGLLIDGLLIVLLF